MIVALTIVVAAQTAKPSVTALEAAAYRAVGAKHSDPAFRNGDTLAEKFLGAEERAILKSQGLQPIVDALAGSAEAAWAGFAPGQRGFGTAVHARTRHIDQVFEEALKLGATQVVNLGAGLDSRAYRFPSLLRNVIVFELDLPATQEYKKQRVRAALGSLPPHVRYVPIDFAKQDLAAVLNAAGYDRTAKSMFVWEGVTFYIPEAAVDATLRFVSRNSARGSRIVFDYFLESSIKRPDQGAFRARLVTAGEPMIFGIPDGQKCAFVAERGLRVVSDIGINDLRARYVPKPFFNAGAPSSNFLCTAEVI
jgi:methyltransferase (TIGR00027 family)